MFENINDLLKTTYLVGIHLLNIGPRFLSIVIFRLYYTLGTCLIPMVLLIVLFLNMVTTLLNPHLFLLGFPTFSDL